MKKLIAVLLAVSVLMGVVSILAGAFRIHSGLGMIVTGVLIVAMSIGLLESMDT